MHRLIRGSLAAAVVSMLVVVAGNSPAFALPSVHGRHRAATVPGATLRFIATAYCQSGITQSGVDTHSGIVAADPTQLPVGSVVHIDTGAQKYNGIYTVLDTGTKVLGKKVDVYMHDCSEAHQFGKQQVRLTVLRKGWSPRATAPKAVVATVVGK